MHDSNDSVRQFFFDVLPEIVFLSISTLLLCLWARIYFKTQSNQGMTQRKFWIMFASLISALIIAAAVMMIVMHVNNVPIAEENSYEGIYLGAMAGLLALGVLIFGVSLMSSFRKMRVLSKNLTSRLRRTVALVIITVLCSVFKCIYILVIGEVVYKARRSNDLSLQGFAVIWFFYFFVTEVFPTLLILYIFLTWPYKRHDREMNRPLMNESGSM
jgi:hypothetical protein